ncbi:HYR domain-containing protein, partial [Winogradskyella tangerina]|uniref:HYR domain-containing protein n=1 Tax=Winogradskyella tangerina TaxID=2023240 RepID=UPI000DF31C89
MGKKRDILIILCFILGSFVHSQSGIYESYAILDINSSGNTYYDLQASTINTDFDGHNLGTFQTSNTSALILNGAQNKTFKCNTDNITNGFLNYRIYLTSNPTPPAFIGSEIFFFSNDGSAGCTGTDQNQTWESSGAGINVLDGLCAGTYYLEVYTTADFTFTSGAGGSGTHFANNGTANYKATFTVQDDINPTITCPANITVNNDNGVCGADVNYNVPFADNCPGSTIAQTAGIASGGTFPIGTTTNSFTVTDAAGNTTSCSFTVTVIDNEDPTITCPANITVNNDSGVCGADVNYNVPFADNCPGSTIAQTAGIASGGTFPIGTTTN